MLDFFMFYGAEYAIFLSLILAVVLAIKGGTSERRALPYLLIAIPIAILLIKLIHIFIYTDRPFVAGNFIPLISAGTNASFPSRHVSVLAAVAFAYIFTKSRWAILQFVLLAWVGLARVYSGVHYPIDILGGILTGLVSVLIAAKILKLFQKPYS